MSVEAPEREQDQFEYTDYEQDLARRINEAGQSSFSVGEVALGIGAAFVLYRTVMRRVLAERIEAERVDTTDGVIRLVNHVAQAYMPTWVNTLGISLASGFASGLREVRDPSRGDAADQEQWVRTAALRYAESLGESVHDVSARGLVEGVRAQINRGVVARRAIDRAIDAFGVAPRTMKALVGVWTRTPTKATTSRAKRDTISEVADKMIARGVMERAATIGDTEAHLTSNVAKGLYWAYQLDQGGLPDTARKQWVTADDELVCPVCGPLHEVVVRLDEKFELPDGREILAPGTHPSCRCGLRLVTEADEKEQDEESSGLARYAERARDYVLAKRLDEVPEVSAWGVVFKAAGQRAPVRKARGQDAYDRDSSGRFASTESRGGGKPERPKVRVRRIEGVKSQVDYSDPRAQQIVVDTERRLGTKMAPKLQPKLKPRLATKMQGVEEARAAQRKETEQQGQKRSLSERHLHTQQSQSLSRQRLRQAQLRETKFKDAAKLGMANQFAAAHEALGQDVAEQETAFHYPMNRHGTSAGGVLDYDETDPGIVMEFYNTAADEMYEEVAELGYDMFESLVNYNESEEYGSWAYERAMEDDGTEDYTIGTPYYRMTSGGRTLYLSRENFAELAANVFVGVDDTIDVRWGVSGRGHVASADTGAYAEETFTTSDILTKMGGLGDELIDEVVDRRLVDVVVVNRDYDDDDFTPEDLVMDADFEQYYEDMKADPFNPDAGGPGVFGYQ